MSSKIPESLNWKVKAKEAIKEWNQQYYLWKMFDKSQSNLIKSFVGLILFNKPEIPGNESLKLNIDIETLYNLYNVKQKNVVVKIYNQFQFDNNQLHLSHTVLYLSKEDKVTCLFRQIRPNGKVYFIDMNGRVYESWKHFVNTNQLPECEYMAPKHGIHSRLTNEVEVHKSPRSSKLEKVFDCAATGAGIVSITLCGLAVAPVTAFVLGSGAALYGLGHSVNTLVDRRDHRQSIAPTDIETISCYMSIGTTVFCSASTLVMMKSKSIINFSGKYSSLAMRAIRGVNYLTAAGVISNFGLYLYCMQRKCRNGQLSLSDLMDLSINVFLIYGAVSNVRQMHSYLSTFEANPTPPKGISKSARRRWRKRQAKLRSGVISSLENQDMTKVGTWDPEISNFILKGSGLICSNIIQKYHPQLYEIYDSILIMIKNFRRFYANEITLEEFIPNLYRHGRNLYELLKEVFEEMRKTITELLQRCGIIAAPELIPDLSNIIDDGRVAINNVGEEISLEDNFTNELLSSPTNGKAAYEIILDLVEYRICEKQVNEISDAEKLLAIFVGELLHVTNDIKSTITQQYEDMLSSNVQMLGKEKAKQVLSQIGINSKTDFANEIFHRTIENLKAGNPVDVAITLKKHLNEIYSLYRELFLTVAGENGISSIKIWETCDILNKSVEVVMQPIIMSYKKSKEIYEINIKFFGHEHTLTLVLAALNLNDISLNYKNYDELIFINIAKKMLDLSEIVPQLISAGESNVESVTELVDEPVIFTDEYTMVTLLSTCDFYVQRMKSSEITKIYSFITDEFVNQFQHLVNQQNSSAEIKNKLKLNIDVFGKNNFNLMCRFLYESNKMEIFNQTAEMFRKEHYVVKLIAEYKKKMHDITNFHAEHLKHIMADDGVTIYTLKVQNRNDINEFKQQAATLFNLNKYNIYVVKKVENLIVLRNADKYVVFQFINNETEALIMQIDLSKKNEENE